MTEINSTEICGFDGCGRPLYAKELCKTHYGYSRKGRVLRPLVAKGAPKKMCDFLGCDNVARGKGLCGGHRAQMKKGQQLAPLFKKWVRKGSAPRIACDEVPCPNRDLIGPCHIFRGCKNEGYGRITVSGKHVYVHRYIWEKENGPIPDDLEIDHMCRVRSCNNVDHLRAVSHKVNCTENITGHNYPVRSLWTHCKNGHEYTEENIYRRPSQPTIKLCRACRSARHHREWLAILAKRKIQEAAQG